jgi:hypothetical protein
MQSLLASPDVAWAGSAEEQAAAASLVFAYSCVWALGGHLLAEAREPFDGFLRGHLQELPVLPGEGPAGRSKAAPQALPTWRCLR